MLAFPLMSAVGAATNLGLGLYGMKRRREERRAADIEYNEAKATYQGQDLTNPMLNMENPYEDLTVNQQAAQFTADQQNQMMANTMDNMKGAAGGSGVASLAQAMARQASMNAQAASASIGQQEQANQSAMAQGAMAIQNAERQGEIYSRGLQRKQAVGELEMGAARLNTIKAEQQAAFNQQLKGAAGLAGVGLDMGQNAVAAMGNAASPVAQYLFGTGGNILHGQSQY